MNSFKFSSLAGIQFLDDSVKNSVLHQDEILFNINHFYLTNKEA